MVFTDKTLVCSECGAEFVHSAADQARYAERGFTNEPKRCRGCRDKRKGQSSRGYGGGGGGGGGDRGAKTFYNVVCSECGAPTTVPFKPTEGRPVYCRDCFQSKRG